MAQTITSDGDKERLGEGVERIWGPLPLESTAKFGAHAPVCSLVVHPVLDADLLAVAKAGEGRRSVKAGHLRRYLAVHSCR